MKLLCRFRRMSWIDRCNALALLYEEVKGILLYRRAFKVFGKGSRISKPMLISNPEFISVGNWVSVRPGVRLEALQSDPSRIPDLRIGDRTNIEQNVHIICHS